MMRSKIKEVSNVYIDMFNIIANIDGNCCQKTNMDNWLGCKDLQHKIYGEIVHELRSYLQHYNYALVHAFNMIDMPISTITSDVVGKFYIIKNEDKFLKTRTNNPLGLYATKDIIGKLIGTKGANINSVVAKLNEKNKFWNVPYISINDIEERTENNNIKEINKKFFDLLDNYIF